jgi:hypothetical protein
MDEILDRAVAQFARKYCEMSGWGAEYPYLLTGLTFAIQTVQRYRPTLVIE